MRISPSKKRNFTIVKSWVTRLVFLEKQMTPPLPLHLVQAPSCKLSPSCSFTFFTLYILFWFFYVLCCVSVFYIWPLYLDNITRFPLKSWFLDYSVFGLFIVSRHHKYWFSNCSYCFFFFFFYFGTRLHLEWITLLWHKF